MDQTNPLAELTHKRRLSALGTGGSHPGPGRFRGAGRAPDPLRTHLSHRDPRRSEHRADQLAWPPMRGSTTFGFLETPYRTVEDGKVSNEDIEVPLGNRRRRIVRRIAQANAADRRHRSSSITRELVVVERASRGEFPIIDRRKTSDFMDVSPKQMVSVAASLIPFLEHDDANRALMGSNMQRQAVPTAAYRGAARGHRYGGGRSPGFGCHGDRQAGVEWWSRRRSEAHRRCG